MSLRGLVGRVGDTRKPPGRRPATAILAHAVAVLAAAGYVAFSAAIHNDVGGVLLTVAIALLAAIGLALGVLPGLAFAVATGAGLLIVFGSLPLRSDGNLRRDVIRLAGYAASALLILLTVGLMRRARRGLQDSEERFRRAVVGAPFPIIIYSEDGRILQLSRGCVDLAGYTLDDIPTIRAFTERAFGPRSGRMLEYMHGLFQLSEPTSDGEHVVKAKHGGERIWEFASAPLGTVAGKRLVMSIAKDVTERKRAEQRLRESEKQLASSEERLRVAQQVARIGTFEWDLVDNTIVWSPEMEGLYSMPAGGFGGTFESWKRAIHPDDVAKFEERFQDALGDARLDTEWRVLRPDGGTAWFAARGLVFKNGAGHPVRMLGANICITKQKQAEQERERLLAALEERDRRKDEFLAVLSHELRNPLTPIRSSLHVLARVAPGSAQAGRAHQTIERQVDHMARLVGDLLDVSRISRGKIELQRDCVDLSEVVDRTVDDHRGLFSTRGIALALARPEERVWVQGDAVRLAQTLGNLLQNAAKFTPAGGQVGVELRRERNLAVLRVRDTGIGIAPDMLERIFQPFTQADRTLDRGAGGLGIGLALVKGIVELHGGQVAAASAGPGKGAELTIRLAAREPPQAERRPEPPPRAAAGRRVLVIEDSVDAAESLKEALELDDYLVEIAFDGPEGLAKAHSFAPDVVLCDIGLPGMDGYGVARAMRDDQALCGVALVALSGYAQVEDQEKARQAGFDRHLAKPPDLATLERILSELSAQHRAQ